VNPDLNLMDASLNLEDIIETVLLEEKDLIRLTPSIRMLNEIKFGHRHDSYGVKIIRAPKVLKLKISIKDVDETREQIRSHLRN
jgi:hypothetical protein